MDREPELKIKGARKVVAHGESKAAEILTIANDPQGCRCRCDWCRDRRYYLAHHPGAAVPLPIKSRDPEEEVRWHGGAECSSRYPCGCHCPSCHFREAHYVHFHLGHWTEAEGHRFLEAQREGSGKTMGEIKASQQ
jgi:hypothetical protein